MADARSRARNIGKAAELKLARAYGAERNLDQNRDGGGPDFFMITKWGELRGEVKHREKLPQWLEAALDKGDIVFLHEKGKSYNHCAVLMRRDLLDAMLGREELKDAE